MPLLWLKRPQWSLRTMLIAFTLLTVVTALAAKKCVSVRTTTVSILGPITSGAESTLLQPPSEDEIARGAGEIPFSISRIVRFKAYTRADAVRLLPLIGDVIPFHDQYYCLIVGRDGWLPRLLFVSIEHTHLHMVNVAEDAQP